MQDAKDLKELTLKARRRMMDLVAQRDHSEKELRTKLKQYLSPKKHWRKKSSYGDSEMYAKKEAPAATPEELEAQMEQIQQVIELAIQYAKDNRWLGAPDELAVKMAGGLHRRNKGSYYINHWLQGKGLPPVEVDREMELEKARTLVKNKFAKIEKPTREEKAKMGRFLAARGFDLETIRKVINEEF